VVVVVVVSAWPLAAAETSMSVAPSLKMAKAKHASGTTHETITGSFFPSKMLPLGFEVGGRLAVSRVQKGDTVRAGQLLGLLDPEIVNAQVAQAEAGVAAAEAAAALAEDVAGRNLKLKDEGGVSDLQNRSAQTQAKQAQAQVLAAKAQLAQVRAARRRHDLKAPFAGTLIDAPEQTGGMVGPGLPVYILQQLDPLVVKTTIPEHLKAVVKAGLKVRVESVGAPVATDDAVVRLVLPSADPQTRRVPVEVVVPNPKGEFVANTLARVILPLGASKQAFEIPSTALGNTGGEHVFVVDAQGKLKRVPVTVLERTRTSVTLLSGQPLDQVVDYPTSSLVEGAKVTTR
jgi:RND family efflux transporter MFP subunit